MNAELVESIVKANAAFELSEGRSKIQRACPVWYKRYENELSPGIAFPGDGTQGMQSLGLE